MVARSQQSPRPRPGGSTIGLAAVVVLATALAGVLLGGCGGGSSEEPPQTLPATPTVPEPGLGKHGGRVERRLATQFRPHLYFDAAERWRPLEIRSFLAERFADGRGHGACSNNENPPCANDLSGVRSLLASGVDYLDVHGRIDNGADSYPPPSRPCKGPRAPLDCDGGPTSAIYYRRTSHQGRWYWDYWAFYRYNDYNGRANRCQIICDDHEGDWEGVTVITTATERPRVVGAIYAAHRETVEVDAAALLRDRSHVRAFVADGTHATYRYPCAGGCLQYTTKFGRPLPEEAHDGLVAWSNNSDRACLKSSCVRPLPEEPSDVGSSFPRPASWNGWPGTWGTTCHSGCGGNRGPSPHAPGLQTRYLCPWVANRHDTGISPIEAPVSGPPPSRRIDDAEAMVKACKQQGP